MNFIVSHCPICGESLSLSDSLVYSSHFKEKHLDYLNATRKWQFVIVLSLISAAVLAIINLFSANSIKWFAYSLMFVPWAFAFFISLKLLNINGKYR